MTKKHKTFQEQFELLDDIPCMAATFEFLYSQDQFNILKLNSLIFPSSALSWGFPWHYNTEYWQRQNDILTEKLKKYP